MDLVGRLHPVRHETLPDVMPSEFEVLVNMSVFVALGAIVVNGSGMPGVVAGCGAANPLHRSGGKRGGHPGLL